MKQFISRVIRDLRNRYGISVTLKNEYTRSLTASTGALARQFEVTTVKALIEPVSSQRAAHYDLSFIAANKNFTYGGAYDSEYCLVTVLKDDLAGFKVDTKTVVVVRNKVFTVQKCEVDQSDLQYFKLLVRRADRQDVASLVVKPNPATSMLRSVYV